MSMIPCVCVLPISDEKDAGEHIEYGRGDNSTAISVYPSRLLPA